MREGVSSLALTLLISWIARSCTAVQIDFPKAVPWIALEDVDTRLPVSIFDVELSANVSVEVTATFGRLYTLGEEGVIGGPNGSAGETITLYGPQAMVNLALSRLRLAPLHDWNSVGINAFETVAISAVEEGARPITFPKAAGVLVIRITPVNDPPSITGPVQLLASEGRTTPVERVLVTDIDAQQDPKILLEVTVEVKMQTSLLGLRDTPGLWVTNSTNNFVMFRGPLARVNAALSRLWYRGGNNFSGEDYITITVDDLGNTGGGSLTSSHTLHVSVSSINDPPQVLLDNKEGGGRLFQGVEDEPVSLVGFSVVDEDAGESVMRLTLTARHGRLSLASGVDALNFVHGTGTLDQEIEVQGTLEDLNLCLKSLSFTPDVDSNAFNTKGRAHVMIAVDDLGGGEGGVGSMSSKSTVVDIHVAALNDPPHLDSPWTLSIEEDVKALVPGVKVVDVDVNDLGGDRMLEISLSVEHGTLELTKPAGLIIPAGRTGSSLEFWGSLDSVNNAISGLFYQGPPEWSGKDLLSIFVSDQGNSGQGGPFTVQSSVAISVIPVNDPPVILAALGASRPGMRQPVVMDEDTILPLSFLSVMDVDLDDGVRIGGGRLSISMSSTNGGFLFPSEEKENWEGRAAWAVGGGAEGKGPGPWPLVSFTAPLEDVRRILLGAMYVPEEEWNGVDELQLEANDNGNYGSGEIRTSKVTLQVAVRRVNDAPIAKVPSVLIAIPGELTVLQGFSVWDADEWRSSGLMEVSVECSYCMLSLRKDREQYTVAFPEGFDLSSTTMRLLGPQESINLALADITYLADRWLTGVDTITMWVSDNEGLQGNASSEVAMGGPVRAPLPPSLTLNSTLREMLEDESLMLKTIFVEYRDGLVLVDGRVSCSSGTVTLGASDTDWSKNVLVLEEDVNLQDRDVRRNSEGDGLAVRGLPEDVSVALSEVVYTPLLDWNSQANGPVTLIVEVEASEVRWIPKTKR